MLFLLLLLNVFFCLLLLEFLKGKKKEYSPNKNHKILTVLDDKIFGNKKINPIVTELFIRGRKVKISLVFITQSYFTIPKNIRLNSLHYLVMKISNKRKLQ